MESLKERGLRQHMLEEKQSLYSQWIGYVQEHQLIDTKLFSKAEWKKLVEELFVVFIKLIEDGGLANEKIAADEDVKASLITFLKIMMKKGQSPEFINRLIYSLRNITYDFLCKHRVDRVEKWDEDFIEIFNLIDYMSMYTFAHFLKEREEIIHRQREDMFELSTPVIRVWDGILAVPLIGTLDSKRTQSIMEKLLETIVATNARVAIIDITGVPFVDTLVANHLIKTASASKLLGSELIITGISPVIAQTMVHMGVDLMGITTKALMSEGIQLALSLNNYRIVKMKR